ncbi:hypothetical protein Cni_G20205 [Canna indica]|uniref:Uncharacterized protein n=1 Tax=Canna indica TaxID=4628 RepID=A0AAQ3QJA2_9LILI|nr:hypothetical protein Cni_G20205 [Canna indica]
MQSPTAPHELTDPISKPLLDIGGAGRQQPTEKIPPWRDQITMRGVAVGALLGAFFCLIENDCNLSVGLAPNLNLPAGFLSFVFVSEWTRLVEKLGLEAAPFTKQENTMIQTSAVTCCQLAVSGKKPLPPSFFLLLSMAFILPQDASLMGGAKKIRHLTTGGACIHGLDTLTRASVAGVIKFVQVLRPS